MAAVRIQKLLRGYIARRTIIKSKAAGSYGQNEQQAVLHHCPVCEVTFIKTLELSKHLVTYHADMCRKANLKLYSKRKSFDDEKEKEIKNRSRDNSRSRRTKSARGIPSSNDVGIFDKNFCSNEDFSSNANSFDPTKISNNDSP